MKNKIIDLGLKEGNFNFRRWGSKTYERLYVPTRPYEECLEMWIANYCIKEKDYYVSKRSGKWIIKKENNKWLVFNKQGVVAIGYPEEIKRTLSYIKDLEKYFELEKEKVK